MGLKKGLFVYRFFFPACLFLSASLLFIIQPLVAKILLPVYGGTPAVWTVCMLFFQALLLISYAYAWGLSRLKGIYRWRIVHLSLCLLSVFVLPLAFVPTVGEGAPEWLILKNLFLQLGLPLLVVGASAPLLQFAFSQTSGKKAADPYFLYAASNVGSLLALLSYPWLVERYWGVSQQLFGWNIIYLVYLLVLIGLCFAVSYKPFIDQHSKAVTIPLKIKATWVFLSFIPCSLMLGVTFYISTDVAATPLFWVLPLALYLLSFVITFATKPMVSLAWIVRNTLFVLIFPLLGFILGANQVQAIPLILSHLAGFFMLALLCHGKLVASRPSSEKLTVFYFCLALGGVLAGVFNGLVAPRLFAHAYEYPLVLLFALLCIPISRAGLHAEKPVLLPWSFKSCVMPSMVFGVLLINEYSHLSSLSFMQWLHAQHVVEVMVLCVIMVWARDTLSLFLSMSILFVFILMPWFKPTDVLTAQRNFYGVKQVFVEKHAHALMSQSTLHGFQMENERPTDGARAYYAAVLPVVQRMQGLHPQLHAMVLGLGTGIMACQFREEDLLTMVEIDEQVIDIASNPKLFTYLRDCSPKTRIVKNDGRLAAANEKDASYDLLVMDAFNSDAIPVHLLTVEAFALYKQKITNDGVILVNISNRHLNVLPVLVGAARRLDMIVLHKVQKGNNGLGQFPSEWALLTTNERFAGGLLGQLGWRFVTEPETQLWTNEYSNLIPLLKWHLA